jgi:hypothetical protein
MADIAVIEAFSGGARLPAAYETAKLALRNCDQIDECKDWADKAEALKSYARQANDEQLQKMALRIQARAIRRCGELMNEIEPGKNRFDRQEGDLPPNRKAAATEAGLSEHQRKTALRIANIDESEFETAIETSDPPTVTELADRGKQARPKKPLIDLGERTPEEFEAATQLIGVIDYFLRGTQSIDLPLAARGCRPDERNTLQKRAMEVSDWTGSVLKILGKFDAIRTK